MSSGTGWVGRIAFALSLGAAGRGLAAEPLQKPAADRAKLCAERSPGRTLGGKLMFVVDEGRVAWIEALACHDAVAAEPVLADRPEVRLHQRIDDERPDPIAAAVIAVVCVADGTCATPAAAGIARHYAALPASDIEAAAAGAGADPTLSRAFAARYAAAQKAIAATVGPLDGRLRALYVDGPEGIWARRRQERATHADLAARTGASTRRLDEAARNHTVGADLVGEIAALRGEAVTTCLGSEDATVERCLGGWPARPLGDALVRAARLAGQYLLAEAEARALAGVPDLTTAAAEIAAWQARTGAKAAAKWDAYDRARKAGVAAETLLAVHGNPAPAPVDASALWPTTATVKHVEPSAGVDFVTGTIKDANPGKSSVLVKVMTDDRQRRELNVPTDEAEGLAPGLHLTAVVDRKARTGRVVRVTSQADDADARQIRGFSVAANDDGPALVVGGGKRRFLEPPKDSLKLDRTAKTKIQETRP